MTTPEPGGRCPIDLHYADPQPANLDLEAIIVHGRRIRHRSRLTQLGVVMAACVAVVSVIAGLRGFTISMVASQAGPPPVSSPTPVDALVAEHPPANGKLTLISRSPRHWTTVAWATRRGEMCWATFRTPMQGDTGEVECPAWNRSEVPSGADIVSSLFPDVALAGSAHGNGDIWAILGLTNPRAVRVVLTASGQDVSAGVVPVPISAGETVGVFLAWIRVPGGEFGAGAITNEIAYDKSGHSIARVSNPP
ncbi:MAG: hypothetical protein LBV34_25415 [Nocardiopsaceae bacterium]|jgi:hypothetical protein|nr:hypothetical protein [Nocardiopsaceae bacterium]